MKKKIMCLLSVLVIFSFGIFCLTHEKKVSVADADSVSLGKNSDVEIENVTIKRLIAAWKGKSREAFDNYFADYSDEQRIVADEEGGILAYADGCGDEEGKSQNSFIQDEEGTVYELDLKGPESTTAGEVRKVIYDYLK